MGRGVSLETIVAAIDVRLAGDPTGQASRYAAAMSRWLERLDESPSDALVVAVRAQHFERWLSPRDAYPRTRPGYLAWRRAAMKDQAERLSVLLRSLDVDASFIDRVATLVTKQDLRSDAEVQTLEDCACLTFIERAWAGFAAGRSADQLRRVVTRTVAKMSPRAIGLIEETGIDEAALEELTRFVEADTP